MSILAGAAYYVSCAMFEEASEGITIVGGPSQKPVTKARRPDAFPP